MASAIDATKPADNVAAAKADLRANLASAKAEIEALQAITANITPYSFSGNRNRLLNGSAQVCQRTGSGFASVAGSAVFGPDRWYISQAQAGAALTLSQQLSPGLAQYPNALQVVVATSKTVVAADSHYIAQRVETLNWQDMQWGGTGALPVTLSFWVNSTVAGTYSVALNSADGVWWFISTYTVNNANTWEYKTITITPPTGSLTSNWIGGQAVAVIFDLGQGSNFTTSNLNTWITGTTPLAAASSVKLVATANAVIKWTGIQLEAGSAATPFELRNIALDTTLCQRFFYRSHMGWQGYATTGMAIALWHTHRGPGMRIPPTLMTRFNETATLIGTLVNTAGADGITFTAVATGTGQYTWVFDLYASAEIT